MSFVTKLLATAAGRWVLGGAVALLLGSGYAMWHKHKQNLREEGRQECVQKVNEETHEIALEALARERATNAQLQEALELAESASREALERRQRSEAALSSLQEEMEAQREVDPEYAEWSDTPLPDGVADRLRRKD